MHGPGPDLVGDAGAAGTAEHRYRPTRRYQAARDGLAGIIATRVVLIVVAGLALGLISTPQAIDSFVTLGQEDRASGWLWLSASTAWLAVNARYWARAATRPMGNGDRAPRHETLTRLLGLSVFLAVAAALWSASTAIPSEMMDRSGEYQSGFLPLRRAALAIAVLGAGFSFLPSRPPARWRRARRVVEYVVPASTLAIAALGMWLFGTQPVQTAAWLPPGPAMLFAAAGMICVGVTLSRLGARYRVPVLELLIAGAAVLAVARDNAWIPDNHDLARLPGPARARTPLPDAFRQFLAANPASDGPTPVVLVVAGGGGLAAAYFTATILGDLADASPDFARHVFAISGVSGGALGITAFAAAHGKNDGPVRPRLQSALAANFLGPALGVMLYSDLAQRFLPVPLFPDRAAAIEAAWASHWRATFGDDRLNRPFLDLWRDGHPWPALLLNGTSARTGGRLVTSNLALGGTLSGDAADLLDMFQGELTAAAAAGTSVRFPYFAPMGAIRPQDGAPITDWVADGGYFESLGATTGLDLVDGLAAIAAADGKRIRFAVIEIINDPDLARPEQMIKGRPPVFPPVGLAGPIRTLMHARKAHGLYAAEALARRVLALGGVYVPVRLGQSPTGATAPLGWSLSPFARDVIANQWTPACRAVLLAETGFGPVSGRGDEATAAMNLGQM